MSIAPPTVEELLAQGCTPKLAEMLAAQQAPGAKIDGVLLRKERQGHKLFDNMPPELVKMYRDRYRRETGREMPGNAFIADELIGAAGMAGAVVMDENDIRTVAKEHGMSLAGGVNCDYDRPEPPKKPGLAPDIVEDLIEEKVLANPALALKQPAELREMVIDQHGPKASD